MTKRLRLALQKKGRLADESLALLKQCGLQVRVKENALLAHVENFPIDLLFVRDDDIPTLVFDGLCDAGIVGENLLYEKAKALQEKYHTLLRLNACACRLSIAVPLEFDWKGPESLSHKRIATSYPYLLKNYLDKFKILAECVILSGSVEMAPRMGIADAICDLVSSGQTLEENKLKERDLVFKSQATLIQTIHPLDLQTKALLDTLVNRMRAVEQADTRKYILFHAPVSQLETICACLPGAEFPTVVPLGESSDKVAVHVVSKEQIFWNTLEQLKGLGATSILVLPIEKMLA